MLRPGIVGMRGSMAIRLRACMILGTPPPHTITVRSLHPCLHFSSTLSVKMSALNTDGNPLLVASLYSADVCSKAMGFRHELWGKKFRACFTLKQRATCTSAYAGNPFFVPPLKMSASNPDDDHNPLPPGLLVIRCFCAQM